MNSKVLVFAATCFGLAVSGSAQGAFFGSMTGLTPRAERGVSMIGGYAGIRSNEVGAFGQLRFGVGSKKFDLGVEGGFSRYSMSGSSETFVGGQLDARGVLFHPSSSNENLHIGGDAAFFYTTGGNVDSYGITAIPAIDITVPMSDGASFTGWAGLGLIWQHSSFDGGTFEVAAASVRPFGRAGLGTLGTEFEVEGGSTSDTSGILQLGGSYDFSATLGVAAEFRRVLQDGAGSDFMFGVNYNLGSR